WNQSSKCSAWGGRERGLSCTEPSAIGNKIQSFVFIGHEVDATMAGDDNGPARVAHARSFEQVPSFHQAVNEARRESIAGAKNIINFHWKAWHIARRPATAKKSGALCPSLHDNCLRTETMHSFDGGTQIAGHHR